MKKVLLFAPFAFLLYYSGWLGAQTITQVEYFYDTDPGVGRGTVVTLSSPSDSVVVPLLLNVGSMPSGFHFLFTRFKYSTGLWGLQQGRPFLVNSRIDTGASPKISAGEYFFDTDPGVGHGTALTGITASDSVNLTQSISVNSLSTGFHHLYVRFQYADGTWGLQGGRDFYVVSVGTFGASPLISSAEYFFDTDPGVGHGTAISVGTASDSVSFPVSISVGSLSPGFHHLYIRFQYANGVWGLYDGRDFYIIPTGTTGASPQISAAEYFFDTDPGVGHGTAFAVGTASDSVSFPVSIPVGSLSAGFHHFYVRFQYANGTWGLYDGRDFYVIPAGVIGASPEIDYAEYFFDHDPGVGNGTEISISPATDSAVLVTGVSATGLSSGPHHLFFRFRYTDGVWGLYQPEGDTINVCTPPVDTIRALGSTSYCAGGSVTLRSDTSALWQYQWQRNGNNLPGDTFSTLLITDSGGVYNVVVTDTGCPGTSNSITVVVNQSTTNSYSQSICSGQSLQFYNHTLTTSGTYRDTLNNVAGCDSFVILTLSVTNGIQTDISGAICPGSSYLFKGLNLTQPGTYIDSLHAVGGCDSFVVLTLSFKQIATSSFNATICQGDSYTFNLKSYSIAGAYHDTLNGSNGCDSIATLVLAINNPVTVNIARHICLGSTYSFGLMSLDTSGTYRDTVPGSNTCDSITILQLTVLAPVTGIATASTCYGTPYPYHGNLYDTAGTYIDTLLSSLGCDSIVTLTLQVLPLSFDSTKAAICQGASYPFGGANLTSAGNYNDTLRAANGCDSIVTLTLSVNALPLVGWSGSPDTICNVSSPLSLSGGTPAGGAYSGAGVYHSTFYPDSVSGGSHVLSYTYTDSSACSDTAYKTVLVKICTGIATLNESNIKLYPNPASDEVTLESDAFISSKAVLVVRDVTGKTLDVNYNLNGGKVSLHTAELAAGVYIITIWLNEEQVSLRFVKE